MDSEDGRLLLLLLLMTEVLIKFNFSFACHKESAFFFSPSTYRRNKRLGFNVFKNEVTVFEYIKNDNNYNYRGNNGNLKIIYLSSNNSRRPLYANNNNSTVGCVCVRFCTN